MMMFENGIAIGAPLYSTHRSLDRNARHDGSQSSHNNLFPPKPRVHATGSTLRAPSHHKIVTVVTETGTTAAKPHDPSHAITFELRGSRQRNTSEGKKAFWLCRRLVPVRMCPHSCEDEDHFGVQCRSRTMPKDHCRSDCAALPSPKCPRQENLVEEGQAKGHGEMNVTAL